MKFIQSLKIIVPCTIIFCLFFLCVPEAMADSNFLNTITDQYATTMRNWSSPLLGYAQRIFWLLALLDIAWTAGKLIFNHESFGRWSEEIIKQFLIIGTFYAIMTHWTEWAPAIIQSFRIAGNEASGAAGGVQGLQPSDVFNSGIVICTTLFKNFSLTFDMRRLIEALALVFGGFLILISFCMVAALEIVTLLESYLFMYAGVLFLGFSGSHLTADIAKRYMIGLISIGSKLFTIQLIIGLGNQLFEQWTDMVVASNGNIDLQLIFMISGGAFIMMLLAKMVPELSQSTVTGASFASINPLVSTGAAINSTATAAAFGGAAVATAMFNPAMSKHFARAAGDHASEAFRHTTGHSVMNPMYGFGRGQEQQNESAFTGRRPFRGDLGHDREIDPPPNNPASTPGVNNDNSISN